MFHKIIKCTQNDNVEDIDRNVTDSSREFYISRLTPD